MKLSQEHVESNLPWLIVLVLLVFACFALPVLLGLDHETTAPKLHNQGPSASAPFGTDNLGRNYFARVLVGGQTSLLVGLVGAVVVVVIGAIYGAVSGYFGGWVDEIMMRVVDFLYGIPYMFLVVLIMLQFGDEERGSNLPIFVALAAVQWLTMARIVRAVEENSVVVPPLTHVPRTKRGVISYAARDIGERLLTASPRRGARVRSERPVDMVSVSCHRVGAVERHAVADVLAVLDVVAERRVDEFQ